MRLAAEARIGVAGHQYLGFANRFPDPCGIEGFGHGRWRRRCRQLKRLAAAREVRASGAPEIDGISVEAGFHQELIPTQALVTHLVSRYRQYGLISLYCDTFQPSNRPSTPVKSVSLQRSASA